MPTPDAAPDPAYERYLKTWARMDRADRRRVMRAVNRMQAMPNPAEAALAVEFAKRQRRMWIRWWWVLPVLSGLLASTRGWEAALINAAFGAVFVGLLAAAFAWRASRSLALNQAVVDEARRSRRSGSPKKRRKAQGTGGSKNKRKGGHRRR
jgi:hypothetical protein